MIIAEQRPQSDEPTNSEYICLDDINSSFQSTNNNNNNNNDNNNTIEETAVIHRQPSDRQIVQPDDNDDDDSSYSYDDEDDNVAHKQVSEIPQPNVENKVSNSDNVTITNKYTTVIQGSVVINRPHQNNLAIRADILDRIDVVPTEKIHIDNGIDNVADTKLSDVIQPLCTQDKDKRWFQWCTKRRLVTISGAVLTGLAIIGLIVYFLIPDSCDVCIVTREEWHAKDAINTKPLAVLPAKYVIIIHTNKGICLKKDHCSNAVRNIQKYDMNELNKTDISYNWLVGGDGLIYECRGWDVEGDHTDNYDNKSIGIGFIGTFNSYEPTKVQVEMGKKLIKQGVEQSHISKDHILVGQRQCVNSPSGSPGDKMYEIIKTWNNYSPACF